jgi:hypothetical protein
LWLARLSDKRIFQPQEANVHDASGAALTLDAGTPCYAGNSRVNVWGVQQGQMRR